MSLFFAVGARHRFASVYLKHNRDAPRIVCRGEIPTFASSLIAALPTVRAGGGQPSIFLSARQCTAVRSFSWERDMKLVRLGVIGVTASAIGLALAEPALAIGPAAVPVAQAAASTPSDPEPPHLPSPIQPMVDVNPKRFIGGDALTIDVLCATTPQVLDQNNLFISMTPFKIVLPKSDTVPLPGWESNAVTSSDIHGGWTYKIIVLCGDTRIPIDLTPDTAPSPSPSQSAPSSTPFPSPSVSLSPSAPSPLIPSGAPQTGDGSSRGKDRSEVIAGGGLSLTGMVWIGYLLARRRSSTDR